MSSATDRTSRRKGADNRIATSQRPVHRKNVASSRSLFRALRPFQEVRGNLARGARRWGWATFAALYASIEMLVLVGITLIIGQVYYSSVLGIDDAFHQHIEVAVIIAALIGSSLALQGGYRIPTFLSPNGAPNITATSFFFAFGLLVALLFLSKTSDYSRVTTGLAFVAGFIVVHVMRQSLGAVVVRLLQSGWLPRRRVFAIVSAEGDTGVAVPSPTLCTAFDLVETATLPRRPFSSAVNETFIEAVSQVAERVRGRTPDHVVICLPWTDRDAIAAILDALASLPVTVYLDGDQSLRALAGEVVHPSRHPLGYEIVGPPITKTDSLVKRSFDIVGAAFGLVLLSPVLAVTALLVKLDSPGPVIFKQRRYGTYRDTFEVFKFRTMIHGDAEAPFRQATRDDPRFTRVGRWLRRTNIDEIPQLANVLLGSMSLVGPRPHPVALDDRFSRLIEKFAHRYRIRPGITGWAQVNGYRGETDTIEKMQRRLEYDLYYIRHWSLWLDLKILLLTVLSFTPHRNAV